MSVLETCKHQYLTTGTYLYFHKIGGMLNIDGKSIKAQSFCYAYVISGQHRCFIDSIVSN